MNITVHQNISVCVSERMSVCNRSSGLVGWIRLWTHVLHTYIWPQSYTQCKGYCTSQI